MYYYTQLHTKKVFFIFSVLYIIITIEYMQYQLTIYIALHTEPHALHKWGACCHGSVYLGVKQSLLKIDRITSVVNWVKIRSTPTELGLTVTDSHWQSLTVTDSQALVCIYTFCLRLLNLTEWLFVRQEVKYFAVYSLWLWVGFRSI